VTDEGDHMGIYFEWGLFLVMIVSGVIYFIDHKFFYPQRYARAKVEVPGFEALSKKKQEEVIKAPLLADYSRSLFIVFLVVFLIRSFLFEPYVVPSGSMLPTIQLGDFVLVNKFAYGERLPFIGTQIIPVGTPHAGDVAVFKDPANPQISLIKTIIGVPGDRISYVNKQLYVNGKPVPQTFMATRVEPNNANLGSVIVREYQSTIGGKTHDIYSTPAVPAKDFKNLVVPKDSYFAMGDNRDNSDDSRMWGFVPAKNLTGRAAIIFFSWDSTTHSIRFNRIGKFLP
jgi:signal peptidase I